MRMLLSVEEKARAKTPANAAELVLGWKLHDLSDKVENLFSVKEKGRAKTPAAAEPVLGWRLLDMSDKVEN